MLEPAGTTPYEHGLGALYDVRGYYNSKKRVATNHI